MPLLDHIYTRRLFASGEGYVSYRIPGIVAQEDGTLLCCLEARSDRFSDWGDIDIIVLRLDKQGNELSRAVFPSGGGTLNNPVLCALGNGRVLLMYCREYEKAYIRFSKDSGASFGEEREITACLREFPYKWNVCALGPGHALRTKAGRIICPVWLADGEVYEHNRRRHSPSVCGCIYSDDGGETWRRGFMFGGAKDPSETAACELGGEVLFTIRQVNPERSRLFAKSGDGGKTLSETCFPGLPDPICFASLCGDGKRAYLVSCLDRQKRQDLSVSCSSDGRNWRTLYTLPGGAGYGDIAVSGDRLYVFGEATRDFRSVDALELHCFALSREDDTEGTRMIKTRRLTLRRVRAEDWKDLQLIWADAAKSEYARYDKPSDLDDAAVKKRVAKWASAAEGDEHMFFAVCLEGTVIGYAAFNIREEGYELGYCFRSDFHRQGYAYESLSALTDHLKAKGVKLITAGTALANTPSVRLLDRLGFTRTGTEQVSFYKDENGDPIVFEGGVYELKL